MILFANRLISVNYFAINSIFLFNQNIDVNFALMNLFIFKQLEEKHEYIFDLW